ncbi:putative geranylgeranyl pyrophosphate synthetase protein [Phaeoacremonium minimum UCRPA7]|uniref:Putative geranylgeranyl pyrophosphate synthetase protein n=1 Tax=Phaeoacremonium minimum (strain UCR-PA7) TaxID=1286976 RepID=R8BTP9_PHAM7|nr:putative geranylgeranyl pyrophosphate synthetase protein [Phaeoacremonium minimum UCRPA7]EOO02679.1 putative geranylgeranyl pyrophosphate synthetase protein [Phaeoacremonium minimum UCRPA7]
MFLSKRSQKEPATSTATATMPSTSVAGASFLQSPNAIPPRSSSTGYNVPHPPSKSVLRPVAEGDWIGHHRTTRSRKASVTSTSFLVNMGTQPPTPPDPSRYAHEDFNFAAKKTFSEEKEKVVLGPFDYLYNHPGKDFRAQLIKAFDAWLEVPPESLEVITKVVGMLHTASLLVDDVEDNSLLRRGMPVAHSIFGVPQTINSANYIYFCALQELGKLRNSKVINIFTEELLNLHRGQGMDLFWRDTLTCPTEDDYLEMVGNKTGGLFRLGIKLMQAESRSLIDCVPLVNLIGLIFQIQDDYRNLFSRVYSENKGMCEDLTEGKFSFPVIHSVRSDPTNFQLLNILKQKTTDEEVKRYAVKYMEGTGSFEYTKKVLDVLIDRARRLTDEIDEGKGRNRGIHKIIDKMAITE